MFWHIDTDIISLIILIAVHVYTARTLPKKDRVLRDKRFILCLRAGILMTIIDIASSVAMEVPVSRFTYHISMTLYLIVIELVMVGWLYYALSILYYDNEKKRRVATACVVTPYIAYVILVCTNPWNGLFYTLGEGNVYSRGPLFLPMMVGLYAVYVVALVTLIVIRRRHIPKSYPIGAMLLTPLILSLSIPAQLLNPGWLMIVPSYVICLVVAFLFFQNVRVAGDRALLRRLTDMVENFACGVAICDITGDHQLEIKYLSNGLLDIYEADNDTLMKSYRDNILFGVHEDDREMVSRNLINIVDTHKEHEMTYRFVTESGKIKWINVKTKVVLTADSGATVYATYNDLTEQKKLQQQLSDIIHTVPCGICLFRWDGELHPIIANRQLSEMLGCDAVEYHSSVRELNYPNIHPEDIQQFKNSCYEALNGVNKLDITYRSRNFVTGQYSWVHMRGASTPQPDGTKLVYVSYYDVTQEHLAEQKLLESEQALEYAAALAGLWY